MHPCPRRAIGFSASAASVRGSMLCCARMLPTVRANAASWSRARRGEMTDGTATHGPLQLQPSAAGAARRSVCPARRLGQRARQRRSRMRRPRSSCCCAAEEERRRGESGGSKGKQEPLLLLPCAVAAARGMHDHHQDTTLPTCRCRSARSCPLFERKHSCATTRQLIGTLVSARLRQRAPDSRCRHRQRTAAGAMAPCRRQQRR
ncbi:hypothetical protein FA09DRAFT_58736 [Tilletiopsis washingtonensis]|uniref:Uncharacterized protein n=1 Tax=Tilletiopsis washingtonensis TaxID=58919 RepID=A0A316Z5J5_9BASI|nr:hypothetical protein FA09DRAFT_58736 [Tilletiopsis washingtonensis]PWN97050.1 hypothetical protein FA09DRAFT_58736 [Tilletiopsis washingtonensis]